MATATRPLIVVVFEDPIQADQAVAELCQSGFGEDRIGVAMPDTRGTAVGTDTGTRKAGEAVGTDTGTRKAGEAVGTDTGTRKAGEAVGTDTGTRADAGADESPAVKGALTGALAGLGLGALVGLGVLAGVIPGVGPAIVGGTLGVLLSNAAAGAAVAGLAGALIGAGLSEEDAKYYQGELEKGRTVVTVDAGSRGSDAEAILRRHGGYDRTTGAAGSTTAAPAGGKGKA